MATRKKSKDLSDKNKRLIDKTYKHSYFGPDKINHILKSKGTAHISKSKVQKYLNSQDSYTLRKELRRSFKRARVIVSDIDVEWDMDLMDISNLSNDNDGIKYLLVVIDIFSKYLWVQPLKSKTAKEVLDALKQIFNGGRHGSKIRSDKGKEFNNNLMKSYLKSHKIYYFTTQNSETKANYAERVIKTLRQQIYRYLTDHRTYRYINKLQNLVSSYNATPHRSINNIAPKDVNENNSADIFAYVYLKPKPIKSIRKFHFKVGDFVRLSHLNMIFERSYDEHFTREIFKIRKRTRMQGIPVYQIQDFHDQPIKGIFYAPELALVNKDESSLWYIEKKIKKRVKNGQIQWLVKFEDWPDSYNQWIDEKEITDVKNS